MVNLGIRKFNYASNYLFICEKNINALAFLHFIKFLLVMICILDFIFLWMEKKCFLKVLVLFSTELWLKMKNFG